jgi:hypothetical protein
VTSNLEYRISMSLITGRACSKEGHGVYNRRLSPCH